MATTLTGCQFGEAEQDTSPIVIAADLELSGAAAPVGQAYQRALELKVEQLNASGALNGRKIELKVKDNRSDSAESLRNIVDFSSDSQVSAIIMGGCNECAVGAVGDHQREADSHHCARRFRRDRRAGRRTALRVQAGPQRRRTAPPH